MFDDKHVREAIEAEAYLKGEANGYAAGAAKGKAEERSKNEATNNRRVEFLRSHNVSDDLISAMLAIK